MCLKRHPDRTVAGRRGASLRVGARDWGERLNPLGEVRSLRAGNDAKTRLSELVAAAERGEGVIIARGGTPSVLLVAVGVEYAPVHLGVLAGQIELGEDVDEPLPGFAPYTGSPASLSIRRSRCGGWETRRA